MTAIVISGVKECELPQQWAEMVKAQGPAKTFRVIIEPEQDQELEESFFSLAQAMRGMEDEPGPHYELADCKEQWR